MSDPRRELCFHFPKIMVSGTYAHTLTVDDLRQIRDAALKRKEITLPILAVDVEAPGHARVLTTESVPHDLKFFLFEFNVDKKSGAWIIDSRSIHKQNGEMSSVKDNDRVIVE